MLIQLYKEKFICDFNSLVYKQKFICDFNFLSVVSGKNEAATLWTLIMLILWSFIFVQRSAIMRMGQCFLFLINLSKLIKLCSANLTKYLPLVTVLNYSTDNKPLAFPMSFTSFWNINKGVLFVVMKLPQRLESELEKICKFYLTNKLRN